MLYKRAKDVCMWHLIAYTTSTIILVDFGNDDEP